MNSFNKECRVYRCTRCGNVSRASADLDMSRVEERCPDPKAPGGYWYCSYEELVPKQKPRKAESFETVLAIRGGRAMQILGFKTPFARVCPHAGLFDWNSFAVETQVMHLFAGVAASGRVVHEEPAIGMNATNIILNIGDLQLVDVPLPEKDT